MSESNPVREIVFGDSDADPSEHGPIIRILLAIRGSFLLFAIFLGIVMIISGIAVEFTFTNQGVLSAMLVIWGISAIIYGILGFAFVILIGYR